ncbi:MAG: GerMN domain-containing protein, partial [Candidatus Peribacteraceae bacterium]|nr:GerMN domain-containing protein [Candidatus Peribacteraceae bacterium]
ITMFREAETAPVRLVQPGEGDAVGLPMHSAGEAALGTGETLQYRLEDQDGFVLDDHSIAVVRDASGAYVQFSADVLYPRPFGTGGTLVLSTVDATGREINAIAVPVRFIQADAVEVKIYFGNRERDPQAAACDVSYPVARRIPHSDDPVEAALRELLQGPSLSEGRQQFFTSIPDGVRVQDAAWADGVLTVDFSSALMEERGGSCRVTAIRAQIEQTLKQFPSVRSVRITVNGEEEGVLEP